MEAKIAELDVRVKHNESEILETQQDLRDFEKETRANIEKINSENKILHSLVVSIEQLGKSIVAMDDKINTVSKNQSEITEKIRNIEHAPAYNALKFNENIKNKLLVGIIIGAAAFILGNILPFSIL